MFSRRLKIGYFTLAGLNSFATTYYNYYLYFYMQAVFGFGNQANLMLAALNGGVYALGSWLGGRLAQRFGYFTGLKLGLLIMITSLTLGSAQPGAAAQIGLMCLMVAGMSFTWPPLEALISEGETRTGLPDMIGTYNVVWAATGSVAYFSGGALLEKLGLRSMFYVPIAIQFGQLGLALGLEALARRSQPPSAVSPPPTCRAVQEPEAGSARGPGETRSFQRMAWLANPFAFVAINTMIAVVPGVAKRLELSTMLAGFCCSVWCFARVGAFAGLWFWTGWHYRFRFLLAAYVALVGSFTAILLVPSLTVLVAAQLVFGGGVGLIYYSSLFYSMDASDTKGEHGGIHEAVIGLGNCAGPAVGATFLALAPQYPGSGAVAVSGLLLLGLAGLVAIRRQSGKADSEGHHPGPDQGRARPAGPARAPAKTNVPA